MIELILRKSEVIKTIRYLQNDPLVHSAKISQRRIVVVYKTGIIERFDIDDGHFILPNEPLKGKQLQLTHQYGYSDLDDDAKIKKNLVMLPYKDYVKASFIEKRLGIQRMISAALKVELPIQYTTEDLIKDLENVNRLDTKLKRNKFTEIKLYKKYVGDPGRLLIEGLTPFSLYMRDAFHTPKKLLSVINALLKTRTDITMHNLIRTMNRRSNEAGCLKQGKKLIPVAFYRLLLKSFNITNQVIYDPFYDTGSKLIACTLEHCPYFVNNANDLVRLASFIGGEINEPTLGKYDLVLADYNFSNSTQVTDIDNMFKLADMSLIFVPNSMKLKMPKPYASIRISAFNKRIPDFFFYYM